MDSSSVQLSGCLEVGVRASMLISVHSIELWRDQMYSKKEIGSPGCSVAHIKDRMEV